jgi:hypothetical protein
MGDLPDLTGRPAPASRGSSGSALLDDPPKWAAEQRPPIGSQWRSGFPGELQPW